MNNTIVLDEKAVNEVKKVVGGGGSGMNIIDFNEIVIEDFNNDIYNQITNSLNPYLPTYIKDMPVEAIGQGLKLIPVIVNEVDTDFGLESETCHAIVFNFIFDIDSYQIQVLDNDYVRMNVETFLTEEPEPPVLDPGTM